MFLTFSHHILLFRGRGLMVTIAQAIGDSQSDTSLPMPAFSCKKRQARQKKTLALTPIRRKLVDRVRFPATALPATGETTFPMQTLQAFAGAAKLCFASIPLERAACSPFLFSQGSLANAESICWCCKAKLYTHLRAKASKKVGCDSRRPHLCAMNKTVYGGR